MRQASRLSGPSIFMAHAALPLVVVAPFAYLVVCAFIGALLAYPLHFVVPESLDFQALVYKTAEILMALSLFPIGRSLGIGKRDIGWVGPLKPLLWKTLRGFGWGALMLGIHVLLLVLLDVRVLNHEKLQIGRILSLSIKGVLIGIAIASLEEPIFRGFLFGVLLRKTNHLKAVLVTSFYFSALHFLSTDMRPEFAEVRWNTGFIIVFDAFSHLLRIHLDSFIALFVAGAFLSCVRLYFSSSGLSYCIGIHAGWVFVIKATSPLTIRSIVSPLQNLVSDFDGNIGYLSATWTSVLIILLIIKMHRQGIQISPSDGLA
jgi:membrane protease YdiL (CAAX protease family)